MKQVMVEDAKEGIKIKEVPMPKPGPKDVLIKVECAPLMPFDKILGFLGIFPPPYVLGAQASGTVVETGAEVPKEYLNKKVHFGCSLLRLTNGTWQGTWCQFTARPFDDVFVYDQKLSHEVACALYGSPLTAMGLQRQVEAMKPKAVILIPGAGFIAKNLANLLTKSGITVIPLVRNPEGCKIMSDIGHKLVLDTSDSKFEEKMRETIKTYQPTVIVDALSSELSMKIFLMMPRYSTLLIYGALGGMTTTFPTFPLMLEDKTIKGYYWSYEDFVRPKAEAFKELQIVNQDLSTGGKVFGVPHLRTYALADFKNAIGEQASYASQGYGVIKFH